MSNTECEYYCIVCGKKVEASQINVEVRGVGNGVFKYEPKRKKCICSVCAKNLPEHD